VVQEVIMVHQYVVDTSVSENDVVEMIVVKSEDLESYIHMVNQKTR
jgi:hypothetical protein